MILRATLPKVKHHDRRSGAQTHALGRWGDYTYTSIDPSDGMTFWHGTSTTPLRAPPLVNRIGKFKFQGGGASPTPTARTPTGTPASPTPTATGNSNGNSGFAYADGNRNGNGYRGAQVYSYTAAASHAAASALRAALTVVFFGDSRSLASPRNAYFP